MLFSLFFMHISCESFNLTSFAIISDLINLTSFELDSVQVDVNMGEEEPYDRVVVNEQANVYAMLLINGSTVIGCYISVGGYGSKDMRYLSLLRHTPTVPLVVGDTINMVIENITANVGPIEAELALPSTIVINGETINNVIGTWAGNNVPDNSRVELECACLEPLIVEDDPTIGGIFAQCTSSVNLDV